MKSRSLRIAYGLLTSILLPAATVATDVSGSIRLTQAQSDSNDTTRDSGQQEFSLQLSQILTPFVSLEFTLGHRNLNSQTGQAEPFTSRITSPRFSLRYGRQTFSANLTLTGQAQETSTGTRDVDSKAIRAGFRWLPIDRLIISGDYQDTSNVADAAVFGRESHLRSYGLRASYDRRYWSTRYSYGRSLIDSTNRFETSQERHEVGLNGGRQFFGNQLRVNFNTTASLLNRQDEIAEGADLVEPVPPLNGLFSIDTTPTIGELEPNSGLVDGDAQTPAPPGIDIGGAATFRNIGLDLGISNQVTRLEISVDNLSDPNVVWQVFRSIDNLVWEPVPVEAAVFDNAFLRYTVKFPQTVSRYIKAVNISTNSEPLVRVTELRALLDLQAPAPDPGQESTRFTGSLSTTYRPHERISISADIGGSNDEQISAGLVRRDFNELHGGARLTIGLRRDLDFRISYRYENVENLREPVLLRSLQGYSASLDWHPLPTFETLLTASRREEFAESQPLQLNEMVSLKFLTELFPRLILTTEFQAGTLTDFISDQSRDRQTFEQRLDAQATENWFIGGRFSYSRFETVEDFPLRSRWVLDLNTRWRISSRLSFSGIWSLREDDSQTFVQQSYNITYVWGKLNLGGTYQLSESQGIRGTQLSSVSVGYILNRHLRFNASMRSSQTTGREVETARITSLVGSLRLSF